MTGGAAISAIENIASVTNLIAKLIMRASCFPMWAIPPAARIKPRFAQNIPEEVSLLENDCEGSNGAGLEDVHRPRHQPHAGLLARQRTDLPGIPWFGAKIKRAVVRRRAARGRGRWQRGNT